MNSQRRSELKQLLETELQGIEATAVERDAASATVKLDQQAVGRLSRMDAMQQQAMAQAESRRAVKRVKLIKFALTKLDGDDYGLCDECDEPIAVGRLKIDPAVSLCIACAERADAS